MTHVRKLIVDLVRELVVRVKTELNGKKKVFNEKLKSINELNEQFKKNMKNTKLI